MQNKTHINQWSWLIKGNVAVIYNALLVINLMLLDCTLCTAGLLSFEVCAE